MKKIIFSRHAERRLSLYNIRKDRIRNSIEKNLHEIKKSGKNVLLETYPEMKYPVKIVYSVEAEYIIIITAYPLKRGTR